MNKSPSDNPPKIHTARSVLVGAPLIIVLAFAFGFVLLRPVGSASDRLASASRPTSNKTPASKASTQSATPAPLPQTSLPTLPSAPVSIDNSSSSGNTGSTATATPQAPGSTSAPASSTTATGLQQAAPNTQPNTSKSISIKSSSPKSILTNLLTRL